MPCPTNIVNREAELPAPTGIGISAWLGRIVCGDNTEILCQMPSESVDLVVTSPPYDDLRTYGGHEWDFFGVAWLLKRVLKPGGVMVWVVNDQTKDGSETGTSMEQALHFRRIGLRLHDTMGYATNKPPMNDRRYQACWEYMFVVSKGAPKTWNPLMERCAYAGSPTSARYREKNGEMKERHGENRIGESKPRENIWWYPSGSGKEESLGHPAPFPLPLAKDHIASWSNPGDVVLDPFAGSGTTLKAAKELNRHWCGIEINPEYCKIADARLRQNVLQLETI
jgi:DNA modification methylase